MKNIQKVLEMTKGLWYNKTEVMQNVKPKRKLQKLQDISANRNS